MDKVYSIFNQPPHLKLRVCAFSTFSVWRDTFYQTVCSHTDATK